jgi:predicted metal-dependent peptidase
VHQFWFVDGFTTSRSYPYSEANSQGLRYLRNPVKAIVDAYSPQDLYVIFCHTDIYRVDHIQPGDPIDVGKLQSGGTEFYPPFEWTEENLLDKGIVPSVFIYFTDGEANFPNASQYGIGEYEDKCIWVLLTFNGQPFGNDIPFGNRIDITLPNKEVSSI